VSNEVTETIQRCRWDDLLSYRDARAGSKQDIENDREILESGVLCKRVDPNEVTNAASSANFDLLRRIAL
jgi:hypothetical protein